MNPIISLVSGTYNRIDPLKLMVQSFRDNLPLGMPYEIVLVDGGSTDGTIEWAKAQPDVKLIEHGALKGAIIAFTEGTYAAVGKYVLISNDDVIYFPDSILPAFLHLETNAKCGAVAFADNRPLPGTYTDKEWKVLTFPQKIRGKYAYAPYAQVGLFRKWLGDKCGWWGGEQKEMLKPGYVYAGDNMLSTYIWSYGYTVEAVEGCKVQDNIIYDELRKHNYELGKQIENADSNAYYARWPEGAVVPDSPTLVQEDTQGARWLYLPIYEPGWAIQHDPVTGKHGLRDALARSHNKHGTQSIVYEVDYLSIPASELKDKLVTICQQFKPHFILTQIQSPLPLTADILDAMKQACNGWAAVINWNGDYALGGLTSPEMLRILRHVDLQLVVNALALDTYKHHNIKADYWQIGFEDVPDELLPDMPKHDVVWLASLYNENRRNLNEILKQFNYALYQPGDSTQTLYNFGKAKAIYRNAKIAISNNDYPEKSAFVSNRLFQALAAGGCVVLQEHIEGLEERIGLIPGVHYLSWISNNDLNEKLTIFLNRDSSANQHERLTRIAAAGTAFIREHYSFDAQVAKLFELMRKYLNATQTATETVTLRYIGKSATGAGGVPSVVYSRPYEHHAGQYLVVHKQDAEILLRHIETWEAM